ncbi:MAG: hypothetical protein P9L94_04415 [Candidatus Hinthialibacter antarcticus]|nr:hypothetical protein [Candidatus Hinthialibacter antarcticus]
MAEFIASILSVPGEALRQLMLMIPISIAKLFFIAYFAGIGIWVWTLDPSDVIGEVHGRKKPVDLRPYATASMIAMVIIYWLL